MPYDDVPVTTPEKANLYQCTAPLLQALLAELRGLAKKTPAATLSRTKVALINRLLTDLKELLKDESNSKYLDLLDDETLPQYSDVVLIMSQYGAAMKAFHERYTREGLDEDDWVFSDEEGSTGAGGKKKHSKNR